MTNQKIGGRFSRFDSNSGTTVMIAGAIAAAIGSYLFQLVVGRALGPIDFAPVSALWTLQFLIFTIVILPVEQMLVARIVSGKTEALVRLTTITALIGAILAGGIGFYWRDALFAGSAWFSLQLGLIVIIYAWFAYRRAGLAAGGRYKRYGLVTLLESLIRFVVAGAILVAGGGAVAIGWALVCGGLAVLFTGDVKLVTDRIPGTGGTSLLWGLVAANGTGQLLLAGAPLAAGALGMAPAQVSIVFMVMVLYRAPITLAYGVIARVIRPLVELHERDGLPALRTLATKSFVASVPVAIAGWVVGWFIGPALVKILLGAAFMPTSLFSANVAAGMVLATLALYFQQILIVVDDAFGLILPWLVGLAAAVAMLVVVRQDASIAIGSGFLVGEAVASVGLLVAIRTRA